MISIKRILAVALLVAACSTNSIGETQGSNGLVLLTSESGGGIFTYSTVTGTIVYRGKRKLSIAEVSFSLYDSSGARVGTATDFIQNLNPGDRWKFQAFGQTFVTYKLTSLSGF